MLYYKYRFSTKANNSPSYCKGLTHDCRDIYGHINYYNFENNALSCQYMKDNRNIKVLVCFFIIKKSSYYSGYSYYLTDYFLADEDSITLHENFIPDYFSVYNIRCIKTALSPDLSKALIGMYSSNGDLYYYLFDILQYKLEN